MRYACTSCFASVKVATFSQTTFKNVASVKAKDTMPMMPETRKKGEVAVGEDTTRPMVD